MVTDSPDCSEEIPEDGNADGAGDPSEMIATLARASALLLIPAAPTYLIRRV
jgi:hypothetical protein